MKSKKHLFSNTVISLAIALSIGLGAPAFAQIAPNPGFPQDRYQEFKPDADVKYGTLDNGMRYAIQHWAQPKGEIAIRMRVAGGSLNEDEKQLGLMHFLEHMAFNGSKNVKEGDMIPMLEKAGVAFGADSNAYTSFDETVYQLDMKKPEQIDMGLMLMRETAGNLLLDAGAIDRERGIIKGEERARNTPEVKKAKDYQKLTYQGIRMNDRWPIGDMRVVESAKSDEFKKLYYGLYRPERTFLVVVGDVDVAATEKMIKDKFSDWKGVGENQKDPALGDLKTKGVLVKNYVDPQVSTQITFTQPTPYVKEPSTTPYYREDLLVSIANSIVNQRLAKISRSENAPFLGAFISNEENRIATDSADLTITPKSDDTWQQSFDVTYAELQSALKYGFSDAEFTAAIANTQNRFKLAVETKAAKRSADIADSVVEEFANDNVYTSPEDDLAWFEKIAPTLTKEAALQELQKVWKGDAQILYVSTKKPIAGGDKTILAALNKAKAAPVKQPEMAQLKQWDYTNFGTVPTTYKTETIADLGITYVTFPNNVRLVIKPTDFEKGRIRTSINFGQGVRALPKTMHGIGMIANSSFEAGGLGHFTYDDLQKTLAGKTVNFNFGAGSKSFGMSGVTSAQDLPLQMQIFGAYFTDPAWRKDGFNQIKAAKDAIYKNLRSTPNSVFGVNFPPLITSNSDYSKFPTEKEFSDLQLDPVKQAVDASLKKDAIEIVIVGDVKTDDAIKAVAATFGALPTRDAVPVSISASEGEVFTPGRHITTLDHDGRADQAIGSIFWKASDYGDGKKGRAGLILKAMLDVKLTDVLREQYAGTYSPAVLSDFSTEFKNYGYIGAMFNVKPQDVDKYIAVTESIAKDFADGKIDQELFDRARNPAMTSFEATTHNNPWWLNWLATSSWDKNRLTIMRDGKKQYEDLTLEQMKALAKEYFNPNNAQIIKVVPSKIAKPANSDEGK